MKEYPLVSFYMTVKNGMPLLRSSINSILGQTYVNWEAVIVDDGSSDDTLLFLEELVQKDDRFVLIKTGGVGRGRALNEAISQTKGEFVANLDADDLANSNRAEVQVRIMQQYGLDLLSAPVDIIYGENDTSFYKSKEMPVGQPEDITSGLAKRNPVSHTTVMLRRSVLLRVGGYSAIRKSQLDYELWVRMAEHGIKLHKVNCVLGAKRIHLAQSFENKRRVKYVFNSFLVQLRAISVVNASKRYYLYAGARLVYGILFSQKFRTERIAPR